MTKWISFASQLEELLITIVSSNELHVKWLNTLSFLENSGARKIAACEHPTLVKEEMLKHAAEEFRHAHHLKKQIKRISSNAIDTYSLDSILGGKATLHYLRALDINVSRYLKKQGFNSNIKEVAYLLVTYAIEQRASELYPLYDAALRRVNSKVTVRSILLEEKEHLNEMKQGLTQLPNGFHHAEHVSKIECHICNLWLEAIFQSVSLHCG